MWLVEMNNESSSSSSPEVYYSSVCGDQRTFEIIMSSLIGVFCFMILCEVIFITLLCRYKRKLKEDLKGDEKKSQVDDEGSRSFVPYMLAYIFIAKAEMGKNQKSLKSKKFNEKDAQNAYEDGDTRKEAETIKTTITNYFDLKKTDSPYYGFSPKKKDDFALHEQNLRKSEKIQLSKKEAKEPKIRLKEDKDDKSDSGDYEPLPGGPSKTPEAGNNVTAVKGTPTTEKVIRSKKTMKKT